MIRNNSITYDAVESPLMTWRAENPILHAFLVALMTTILAHQTIAMLFDLLIGFKPKGKAVVTDLGSAILAHESSLLSALASICQSDILRRGRFRVVRRTYSENNQKNHGISFPVCSKFVVLFLSAPALTLVSIIISLETDSVVRFRDARFGGIALGFAGNQTIADLLTESVECSRYKTSHTKHELTTASFHLCSLSFFLSRSNFNTSNLSISQRPSEEILIRFETPSGRYQTSLRVDIRIMGEVYRLREKISLEQGKYLIALGESRMLESCGNTSNDLLPIVRYRGDKWNISQSIPCIAPENVVQDAFSSMVGLITVVNTNFFDLVSIKELNSGLESSSNPEEYSPNFVQGDNLPFLKRRRSYLSFAVLCVAVVSIIVFRVILMVLTNNDIDIGIESIVKASLGMNCCDSMLQDPAIIDFRDENFFVE